MKLMQQLRNHLAQARKERFERRLRRAGVALGERIRWGDPRTLDIDLTRPSLVEIGSDTTISTGTTILTHDFVSNMFLNLHSELINSSGKVTIGRNVYVARNCTFLKGVTVGNNCIVGYGTLVTRDVPADSIVAGNPGRVVGNVHDYYAKRQAACVEEAFEYARSIRARFGRRPVVADFWEEFPLFMDGGELDPRLPIERQLGRAYPRYAVAHKARFAGFEAFLEAAGVAD